jgi:hypothetical protein
MIMIIIENRTISRGLSMEMERPNNEKQNKYNRTFHERWKALKSSF